MCTLHITPRCRRPAKGQVHLATLIIDCGGGRFTLPSSHFRTDEAPSSRSVRATDRRAAPGASGVCLTLPTPPTTLVTTAVWHVTSPGKRARDIRHVVQWLLPPEPQGLLSDNTWLWPPLGTTPALSPGDWPVMDVASPTNRIVSRKGLTVIDTRNTQGQITRRYQSFPLVRLDVTTSPFIPDVDTPLN